MMGTKAYQEKMFYNFSLSKRVPKDHFLRKVAKVINLAFVVKVKKGKMKAQDDVLGLKFFKPEKIPYNKLAFRWLGNFLRDYLRKK